ncbi:hypothetical protein Nepgr_004936 [Nepenthes gracilis]|uniref:Trichome birefringence-like N-terminal domain-containing protein n=1 Tax=Nepenthes gracilis TaxID=150966 RepID=A0AAD3S2C8_NEPGR|nr:hypothetical protein Nepgr_004936 [Nepenthes gracilis]
MMNSRPKRNPGEELTSILDFRRGKWVFHQEFTPLCTNSSCQTIPVSKNCFVNVRKDEEFLQWRWEPEKCELPRFETKTIFSIVSGKKMAFIGDSVARNQMESLLCLPSQEEAPLDLYKDAKDRFWTWYFPGHNFTIMVLWTKFLVASEERGINGYPTVIFDLHLDKVDESWALKLPSQLNYAILSDSQWFFRKNNLYQGGRMIGCIYCKNESNVKQLDVGFAIGRALRSALTYTNNCEERDRLLTLVRTISPSHFENGTWKTGRSCNRTSPFRGESAEKEEVAAAGDGEWAVRAVPMEETGRARRRGEGRGRRFEVLDITRAMMMMRPDGHPGSHWRTKKQKKGYNDCVHWCLPGPIDTWNDLLLAILRK